MVNIIIIIAFFIVIGAAIGGGGSRIQKVQKTKQKREVRYFYSKKPYIMSDAEKEFFQRLVKIVQDKYYVFPQVHLSSLLVNKTQGRYRKLAFQRINRRSVDYALIDRETFKTMYAVELDDSTHDTARRRGRDEMVEKMLADAQVPLVRFRNPHQLTDDEIISKFADAYSSS